MNTLADKVQNVQRKSDATFQHIFEKQGNIDSLELKVSLLEDDSVAVVYLGKYLAARNERIAKLEEFSASLNESLISRNRSHVCLRIELDSVRAAIALGKREI